MTWLISIKPIAIVRRSHVNAFVLKSVPYRNLDGFVVRDYLGETVLGWAVFALSRGEYYQLSHEFTDKDEAIKELKKYKKGGKDNGGD